MKAVRGNPAIRIWGRHRTSRRRDPLPLFLSMPGVIYTLSFVTISRPPPPYLVTVTPRVPVSHDKDQ